MCKYIILDAIIERACFVKFCPVYLKIKKLKLFFKMGNYISK
jgi:hypothetical protein